MEVSGAAVLDKVARTIERHRMFSAGDRVAVAVSGGADSTALLHALHELASRWNLRLAVAHFNHRLRGRASEEDAQFAAEMARRLGLEFICEEADVARLAAETGDNLEQAARRARYGFFHRLVREGKVQRVAVGHTRSDQAETVLYRLLRGSGTAGLAGIRPVTREGVVRPLIEVTREELRAWLEAQGIEWREDASNLDVRFARNRIRHELLPWLEREWNPKIREVLARVAMVALDEEAYWEAEMDRLAPELLERDLGGLVIRADRLRELPPAVARRLIRRAIGTVKGDLRGVDVEHVERALELAEAGASGAADLPGVRVTRSFDWLRLAATDAESAPKEYRIAAEPPGEFPIPEANAVIRLELKDARELRGGEERAYNTEGAWVADWERVEGRLELRNWRPGDRLQPKGEDRPRKMKELFERARVPCWKRASWPMLVRGEEIIWTRGFGVARPYVPRPGRRRLLLIEERPLSPGR